MFSLFARSVGSVASPSRTGNRLSLTGRTGRPESLSPNEAKRLAGETLECRMLLAGDVELIKDINQTPLNRGGSSPSGLVAVGDSALFAADASDGSGWRDLWKTDGTEAGTVRVKRFVRGTEGVYPSLLSGVDGTLYFIARSSLAFELWKSDGTETGTVRIKDFSGKYSHRAAPSNMVGVNGTLYFVGYDDAGGE